MNSCETLPESITSLSGSVSSDNFLTVTVTNELPHRIRIIDFIQSGIDTENFKINRKIDPLDSLEFIERLMRKMHSLMIEIIDKSRLKNYRKRQLTNLIICEYRDCESLMKCLRKFHLLPKDRKKKLCRHSIAETEVNITKLIGRLVLSYWELFYSYTFEELRTHALVSQISEILVNYNILSDEIMDDLVIEEQK